MRPASRAPFSPFVALAAVSMLTGCGGGGGGGGKTVTASSGKVTIEAHDISYDIGKINADAGELDVTLLERALAAHSSSRAKTASSR